ncbi:MAG: heme-binding protein, partial [Planctomycetota bacterium]
AAAAAAVAGKPAMPDPTGPAKEFCELLSATVASVEEAGEAGDTEAPLAALRGTLRGMSPEMPVHERLAWLLEDNTVDNAKLLESLREALDMVSFVPSQDAEFPEGFPTFTPVGFIQVKQYPASRAATSSGFWPLFMHIKSKGIAMTTPVKMEYADGDGRPRQQDMSFYYGDANLGAASPNGSVKVADRPAETVVSLGLRGRMRDEAIADAANRLERWVRSHDGYAAAGDYRVMAYSEPATPRQNKYYEVQIPLQKEP